MLSHHHKTIFVHVPKCAGQSVEMAYLGDLGLTWETRAPLLLRFNDRSELGPPRLAHLLAKDYVKFHYVSNELFERYFKFAIVRNPWSRAVSLYKHLDFNMPFKSFATDWLAGEFALAEKSKIFWFIRPQRDFLTDQGKTIVDDILRFEDLASEFGRIRRVTGLKSQLPHVNKGYEISHRRNVQNAVLRSGGNSGLLRRLSASIKSGFQKDRRDRKGDWREFYDDDSKRVVAKLYAADAGLLKYEFSRGEEGSKLGQKRRPTGPSRRIDSPDPS